MTVYDVYIAKEANVIHKMRDAKNIVKMFTGGGSMPRGWKIVETHRMPGRKITRKAAPTTVAEAEEIRKSRAAHDRAVRRVSEQKAREDMEPVSKTIIDSVKKETGYGSRNYGRMAKTVGATAVGAGILTQLPRMIRKMKGHKMPLKELQNVVNVTLPQQKTPPWVYPALGGTALLGASLGRGRGRDR